MKTEDKIEQIFKYTDIYGAKRIFETNTILLKTPNQFNDPNDCDFSFTNEDSRKAFELAQEYYCLSVLKDIIEKEGPRIKKSQLPIIDYVNDIFKAQKSIISKTHVFDFKPAFWKMMKTQIKKINGYKEKMDSAYEQYVTKMKEILQKVRKRVFILDVFLKDTIQHLCGLIMLIILKEYALNGKYLDHQTVILYLM